MKLRLKQIPLSIAQPGMKVGAPVRDTQDRILIASGVELSESTLVSLMRRNIFAIPILEEDNRTEEELAAERVKTTERVNALFSKVEDTANLELLQKLVLEYRLEPLS